MRLIKCTIKLILTWSDKCVLSNDTKSTAFAITDTKLYVANVTLSTQDNTKLLRQLKSGFKRTINWNKYQSTVSIQAANTCLHYLINPNFQRVNIVFVLLFENTIDRTVHTNNCLPTVEINDYNLMIDEQVFFDQLVKANLKIYDNIRKTTAGQGNYYMTSCLLDYNHYNKYYKIWTIDSSKQQALHADLILNKQKKPCQMFHK